MSSTRFQPYDMLAISAPASWRPRLGDVLLFAVGAVVALLPVLLLGALLLQGRLLAATALVGAYLLVGGTAFLACRGGALSKY